MRDGTVYTTLDSFKIDFEKVLNGRQFYVMRLNDWYFEIQVLIDCYVDHYQRIYSYSENKGLLKYLMDESADGIIYERGLNGRY